MLAILIAATALGPMTLNIFIPSMPGLQADFDVVYGTAQLTLSFYLVGLAGAQLVHGPLSDRYGRRPVMIGGLALHFIGTLACLAAPTIGLLIAGRLVQAIGGCVGMVVGRAIVRDRFDRERTASMLAYITMAMVVAPMVAPTIGGFLDNIYGWRASFIFVLLNCLIVLGIIWKWLPETLAVKSTGNAFLSIPRDFARLLRKWEFCGYSFQLSFNSIIFLSFLSGAPYVVSEILGLTPGDYGLYFIPIVAIYMVGNFVSARVSPKVGIDRMISLGCVFVVGGAAIGLAMDLAGVVTVFSLFGPMGIISIGHAFSFPNGMAGAVSVDPKMAGAAAGLSGFLQMALGAVASFVVGSMMADSPRPLVIAMFIGAVLATAAHFIGLAKKNSEGAKSSEK